MTQCPTAVSRESEYVKLIYGLSIFTRLGMNLHPRDSKIWYSAGLMDDSSHGESTNFCNVKIKENPTRLPGIINLEHLRAIMFPQGPSRKSLEMIK